MLYVNKKLPRSIKGELSCMVVLIELASRDKEDKRIGFVCLV